MNTGSTDDLLSLLDYTAWATERLLDAAALLSPEQLTRDLGSSHRSISGTLAHLYGADVIWTARLCSRPAVSFSDLPPLPPLPVLQAQWMALQGGRRSFVEQLHPQERLVYADLRGEAQRSTVGELVRHVVNHATHHRGQVVGMLRQLGHRPPNTDLIAFYRVHTRPDGVRVQS